jgi:hypothetical protein
MTALYIYLAGLPLGFILAAAKRDKWWKTNPVRGYPQNEVGGEYAVLTTFFWFIILPIFLIYHVGMLFYRFFMNLMNGSINSMDKVFAYLHELNQRKLVARKRVVMPASPVVRRGGYCDGAPRPCIACGAETSLELSIRC